MTKVNMPFERLPRCGCDPGTGSEPPPCTCEQHAKNEVALLSDEWRPMDTAPMDGTTIIVKLSTGRQVTAEYWSGPPGMDGDWAFDALASFCAETTKEDSDAEWVGWKPMPTAAHPDMAPPLGLPTKR